jgi:hypothetical protein
MLEDTHSSLKARKSLKNGFIFISFWQECDKNVVGLKSKKRMTVFKAALLLLLFVVILFEMPTLIGFNFHIISPSNLEYSLLPSIIKETTIPYLILYSCILFILYKMGPWREMEILSTCIMFTTLYAVIPLSQFPLIFGDQPRLEVKASTFSSRGIKIEDLQSISGYFYYPSAWLFIGTFISITYLDAWLSSQILTLIIWIIIFLALYIFLQKARPYLKLDPTPSSLLTFIMVPQAFRAYFSPQLYGILFFCLYIITFRFQSKLSYAPIHLLLLTVMVSSHPLTYTYVMSIELLAISICVLKLVVYKRLHWLKLRDVGLNKDINLTSLIMIVTIFLAWHVYIARGAFTQAIIQFIKTLLGETKPEIGTAIKLVNPWYTILTYYRFLGYALISFLCLFSLLKYRRTLYMQHLMIVACGVVLGGIILSSTPGTWIDRTILFALLIAAVIASLPLSNIKRKCFQSLIGFLLFLSIVPSFLGYVAISNPYFRAHQPSYATACQFLSSNVADETSIGAPDGTLSYYLFPKFGKPFSYVHIYVDEIVRLKDVTPENVLSIYRYKLNIVSLKEKTLLPDSGLWLNVDNNLNLGHSLIYSTGTNHIAVKT